MEQSSALTLDVRDLCVSVFTQKGELRPVDRVSLEIPERKIIGIVGESGCGKSMTAKAIMGLIRHPARITCGEVLLDGQILTGLSDKELCDIRGSKISMIFQEPMTSLNPVMKVGRQVEEAIRCHMRVSPGEAKLKTIEMFRDVGIPEPETRYDCYPHQLSGGLRQRVIIAMAMICRPRLLIADEPTTALDVTVEAQILRLMKKLGEGGTSILLISHNLGVIAQICDYVYVMYAGQIVEEADVFTLFDSPLHPYTKGLLGAVSSLHREEAVLGTIPGVVPNLLHLPEGCSFSLRCSSCMQDCPSKKPEMQEYSAGHKVRCHLYQKTTEETPK